MALGRKNLVFFIVLLTGCGSATGPELFIRYISYFQPFPVSKNRAALRSTKRKAHHCCCLMRNRGSLHTDGHTETGVSAFERKFDVNDN